MKTAKRSCIVGHRQTSDKRASWLFSADGGASKRRRHLPNLSPPLEPLLNVFLQSFTFFFGKKKIILLKPDLFCKSVLSHVWWMLQWIKQIWELKVSCLRPLIFMIITYHYYFCFMFLIKAWLWQFARTWGQCCATFPGAADYAFN